MKASMRPSPDVALQTAMRRIKAGDLAGAERQLAAVAGQAAASPAILLLLGRLQRQRGDRTAAAANLRRYAALCPQEADPILELADLLANAGRLEEAELRVSWAGRLAPASEPIRNAAVVLRLALAGQAETAGKREAALAHARAVLALRPDHPQAHDLLCRLLVKEDRSAAARHALAAWRGGGCKDATQAGNAWQLFTHMGEAEEVARFERAVEETGDCVSLVALGNALRRDGQALRAEACYRQALDRFPEASFTLSRLACLCAEQHRLEEADALFREAAARHGGRDVITRLSPSFLAELKAAPPPAGIAPAMAEGAAVKDRALIVYMSCDAAYFALFAPAIVRSLIDNAGLDAAIALHIVNPDARTEAELDQLLRVHGPDRFIILRETVDLAPLGPQAKTYYACSRFLILPDLLARYGRPILMLDTDLMAIRDLNPLLAATAGADFGIMTNALKRLDIWSLLYADVVHIRPTARAHRFLDLVRRYIRHFLKPGTAHWFLDQAALAGVYLAGFTDEPAPRFAWFPTDMHSSTIMVDGDGNYWTEPHACFYSVRATGGGQTAMAKAKRRAGTIPELAVASGHEAMDR